jgi:hypothetical protein
MGFVFTTEPEAAYRQRIARVGAADWVALERRAMLAVGILVISAILDSIGVLIGFLQIELLTRMRDGGEFSPSQVLRNDSVIELIGRAQQITFFLTIVLFCWWMLQALRNALAVNVGRITYTPLAAVASFFIPFVNFVRPYRAMKQLFDASTEPGLSHSVVRVWWGFYLAMGILGNVATNAVRRAEEAPELIVATWLSIASCAVAVPAALLAAHLVRRVSAGLTERLGMVSDSRDWRQG